MSIIASLLERGKVIDEKFLVEIFNMIIEKDVTPGDVSRFRHLHYISELLGIFYEGATPELNYKMLRFLRILVRQSPFNGKILVTTKDVNVLTRLITLLPTQEYEVFQQNAMLIEALLSHSATIETVKLYLSVMHQIAKNDENYLLPNSKFLEMFKTLYKSFLQELKPSSFFDSEGYTESSGLQLPIIQQFPKKSYTLSVWFRAESFTVPNCANFRPRLFSFFTHESNTGLEAHFINSTKEKTAVLKVQYISNGKSEEAEVRYQFQSKKWYHLTLTHTYAYLMRSEIIAYVDGMEVYKGGLKYPLLQELTLNHLFTSQIPNSSFFGQFTSFYFFKEALQASEVLKLFKLGINYSLNHYTKKDFVSKEPLFCYHPNATEKYAVFDITSELYDKIQKKKYYNNASILPYTQVMKGTSICDALFIAGGLDLLLPMFVLPYSKGIELNDQDKERIGVLHSLILQFIVDFLFRNEQFKFEVAKRRGFHLILYLLKRSSPHNLSLELLDPIRKLEDIISLVGNSKEFQELIIREFLFQFSLWASGSFVFQQKYLSFLTDFSMKNPHLIKNYVGVQMLLDILQSYYWYWEEDDSSHIKIHTTDLTSQSFSRPNFSEQEISSLRMYLLQIVKSIILLNSVLKQDIQAIIRFLFTTTDHHQMEDILSIVVSILVAKRADVSAILDDFGSILPFLPLLHSPSEKVALLALKIIAALLNFGSKKTKKISNGKQIFGIISTSMQLHEFSYATYISLLEAATDKLGERYIDSIKYITSAPILIKTPEYLDILFSRLPRNDINLINAILSDFIAFLRHENNDQPKIIFLSHPLFVQWLIHLFIKFIVSPHIDQTHQSHINNDNDNNVNIQQQHHQSHYVNNNNNNNKNNINDLILSLFSILFQACLTLKEGWKYLELMLCFLNASPNPDDFSVFALEMFMNKLTEQLSKFISTRNMANASICLTLQNLAYIACMIDDYIFSPVNLLIQNDVHIELKREHSKWRDFDLAQNLLNLLDSILFSPYSEAINNDLINSHRSRNLYLLILRLILLSLRESYKIYDNTSSKFAIDETEEDDFAIIGNSSGHDLLLDNTSNRLLQLIPKLCKSSSSSTTTTPVIYIVWTLSYLLRSSTSHKLLYQSCHPGISKTIRDFVVLHRSSLESHLKDSLPELGGEAPLGINQQQFCITQVERFTQSIQEKCQLLFEFERIKNEIEEELAMSLTTVAQRRVTKINEIPALIQTYTYIAELSELTPQIEEVKRDHIYAEINRKISWSITQGESLKVIEEDWNHLFTQLSRNESSPWAIDLCDQNQYWMLDTSEDDLRRRWKMILNPSPSNYRTFTWNYIRQKESDEKLMAELQLSLTSPSVTLSSDLIKSICIVPSSNPNIAINNNGGGDERISAAIQENYMEETSTDFGNFVVVDKATTISVSPFVSRSINEKTLYVIECDLISPLHVDAGTIHITSSALYFFVSHSNITIKKDCKWPLSLIKGIHRRRYLLKNTALELFFTDHKNIFLNFPNSDRELIFNTIISTHPPNLKDFSNIKSPIAIIRSSSMTSKWQNHEISNFEYLMYLNTIAGRTYNDLSQYPIFPWIITDYESDTIDLTNPAIYRDLTKPIGALNPKRLGDFLVRYQHQESVDDIPKFLYGSHYSTALVVLYYLIRLEPFTSYYIQLQGRFDHGDRIFDSIQTAWNTALNLSQDVKELIPEFFYCASFLRNENHFDLGEKQNKDPIDHVKLPPWAKGSAEEFVRINAEALESEYVSSHLHHWIDLIFGYQQRGKAAEDANNLFYYLTYEGAVDIDKIEDPILRKSTIEQILSFGQCPSQLFLKPHPPRNNNNSSGNNSNSSNISSNMSSSINSGNYIARFVDNNVFMSGVGSVGVDIRYLSAPSVQMFTDDESDRLFLLNPNGIIGGFRIQPSSSSSSSSLPSLSLPSLSSSSPSSSADDKSASIVMIQQPTMDVQCISILPKSPTCFHLDIENNTLISYGHWDGSIRVTQLQNTSVILQTKNLHKQPVTCIDVSKDSSIVACGSDDCTISVWKLHRQGKVLLLKKSVMHLLRGHSAPISCITLCTNFDVVVSGSVDGTIVTHTLYSGSFIRYFTEAKNLLTGGVDILKITNNAQIIAYSKSTQNLVLFNINGKLLAQSHSPLPNINTILMTSDGKYFVVIGCTQIRILLSHNLEEIHSITKFPETEIISAAFMCHEKYLVFALRSSTLQVCLFSP